MLRDALHLLGRGDPPAGVPDHHHEHHRDQRDFREVIQVLLPSDHLPADQAAGGQRHDRDHQDRGSQPPEAEAVEGGQANPDDQERDGLPGGEEAHGE